MGDVEEVAPRKKYSKKVVESRKIIPKESFSSTDDSEDEIVSSSNEDEILSSSSVDEIVSSSSEEEYESSAEEYESSEEESKGLDDNVFAADDDEEARTTSTASMSGMFAYNIGDLTKVPEKKTHIVENEWDMYSYAVDDLIYSPRTNQVVVRNVPERLEVGSSGNGSTVKQRNRKRSLEKLDLCSDQSKKLLVSN